MPRPFPIGHLSRRAVSFAGAALGVVLLAVPASGLYREFRDWSVACTNGLTCTMQFTDYDSAPLQSIALERSAAPSAPLSLLIGLSDFEEEAGAGELALHVDGAPVARFPLRDAQIDQAAYALRLDPEAAVDDLLQAMKSGTRMEARVSGGASLDASLDVSLSGVVASLVFMDEAQGRVGRKDALQAKGGRPVPAEGPARDIAGIEALPESMRADFSDDADCGFYGEDASARGFFALRPGDAGSLIGAPCGPGGAYNQLFVLYAGYGERMRRAAFPIMTEDGPSTMGSAYNLDVEAEGARLTAFFRGRGLGDCGSYHVWRIGEDGTGPVLTLLEQRFKDDCDGDYAGGPREWPLSWPSP